MAEYLDNEAGEEWDRIPPIRLKKRRKRKEQGNGDNENIGRGLADFDKDLHVVLHAS
jgi:hypothetical protein